MFITATIQITVSGMPTPAGRSTGPRNGNVKWSIQTPKKGGIEAATTWPASLRPGLSTRKSSIAPTTVATAAPSSTPRVSRPSSRNASAGTKMPKKIASPPSRGIGLTFSRRLVRAVDDAEEPRHPADRGREQDHDQQRERAP